MLQSLEKTTKTEFSSPNYQRILVAVDYWDSTPEIFQKAMEMAQLSGGQLMIFHCLQGEIPANFEYSLYLGPYAGVYSAEMLEIEEKLVQEAMDQFHAWLDEFVQQAAEYNVSAETCYRRGDPGRQICSLAKDWNADLILVGRSGKTGLSELVLGSVSNYVFHHAPCAVLVVQ